MVASEAQPYVGPRPFKRGESYLFFGRDREAHNLRSLVIAHPVALFYAESGAGKTSLLNARFIPLLEEKGIEVLPLARVRGLIPEHSEPVEIKEIPNLYVFNTLMNWTEEKADPRQLAQMSLADFLEEGEYLTDEGRLPSPRVVIFDQFEELFTFYPERWRDREEFFKQVADALEKDSLLRVIFVMREEYLAQLDPYAPLLPERLRTRFRLERLREGAALSAVTGPLAKAEPKRCFAEGVAEQLVEELLKVRVQAAMGESVEMMGEFVEPVQLQVVCQSLWQDLPPDVTVIKREHLQAFGDVAQALSEFYERSIERAAREAGIGEGDLRKWFGSSLITPAGTRGTVFRGAEETGKIPNAAVDVLENQYLIRGEWRAGARWYELAHDGFIEPIQSCNRAFVLAQERAEAEEKLAQERAEAKEKLARERRRWGIGLGVLILVVSATFFAWWRGREQGIIDVISWLESLPANYALHPSDMATVVRNKFRVGPTDIIGGGEEEEEEEEEELPPTSVLTLGELVEATYRLRSLKNGIGFVSESLDPCRFRKISSHEHYRVGGDIGAYFEAMGTLGIQKVVFFPTGFGPDNRGYPENMEELLRLQKSYPKQIIAFCTVDEGDAEAPTIFKDCLEKGGRGLKLIGGHPDFYEPEHPLDSPTMMQVYEIADRHHVPVVIHINMRKFPELQSQFEHILQTFPDVPFVAAHYCKDDPPFELCAHLLDTYSNLHTDLSMGGALDRYLADISLHRDDYRNFILRYQDRILWGADLIIDDPQTKTADFIRRRTSYDLYLLETGSEYEPAMEDTFQDIPRGAFALEDVQLFGLDLPEETLRKIYWDNPRRVLSLSD